MSTFEGHSTWSGTVSSAVGGPSSLRSFA